MWQVVIVDRHGGGCADAQLITYLCNSTKPPNDFQLRMIFLSLFASAGMGCSTGAVPPFWLCCMIPCSFKERMRN